MFIEPSDKSGQYEGVGPHVIGDFYVPPDADAGGIVEFRIGGLTSGGNVIAGKYSVSFRRSGETVDAGGLVAMHPLVAPIGCLMGVDATGGYVRLLLTGVLGLNATISVRADAMGGP